MTIQTTFLDILKMCNLPKLNMGSQSFPSGVLKLSVVEGKLRVQTYDDDRVLFIDATTHETQDDIVNDFGLSHFKTLRGLLTLPNFKADDATMKIGTREVGGSTYPDQINFKGGGSKATFRLVNHELIPDQPTIMNIPWDITLTLSASKLAEFQSMAALYTEVESLFTIRSDGTKLVVDFGNDGSSTHSGSMVLADEVEGSLVAEMRFPIQLFLALMKLSGDANSTEVRLTSKGLMAVVAVTASATYHYYVKKSL